MWRKFRKKRNEFFPRVLTSTRSSFFELILIRAMWYFFPRFTGKSCGFRIDLLDPSARVYVFVSTFRVRTRERKKSERRQEGIITGTRPFAVDRDEESEASICLLRGVFHPFIGFVNFATGYVITGQAKPRKSVRGKKREREKGWKREKRETGVLKKSGQMEWYYCAIETSTVLKKFVLLRIPIND